MKIPDSKLAPDQRIAENVKTIPRSGIRDFFEIVTQMKSVISLGIGEPDFVTPWHIREHAMYALERGVTSYTSNLGLLSLRKELSRYVERVFDISYNPEDEILVTVGVSEALDLVLRALLNPGDEVIYHEPCYVSYRPLIQLAHGVPVAVSTHSKDAFRVTRAAIEEKITPKTRVLLLNFPNNPTGAALSREDVEDLARMAVEHDLMVVTDEIYAELTYNSTHVSIAAMPGMRERTVFLHGFSKAWAMTGFRVGYSCAPPYLTDAMMKIHQYSMLCAPVLSQEAALEALKRPEKDISEMKEAYNRRRRFITAAFHDIGIPCHLPAGAFYAFPDISKFGISSHEFSMRLLKDQEVAAVPGTAFGECGEGFIRCSYATALNDIKIAMERIGKFVQTLD